MPAIASRYYVSGCDRSSHSTAVGWQRAEARGGSTAGTPASCWAPDTVKRRVTSPAWRRMASSSVSAPAPSTKARAQGQAQGERVPLRQGGAVMSTARTQTEIETNYRITQAVPRSNPVPRTSSYTVLHATIPISMRWSHRSAKGDCANLPQSPATTSIVSGHRRHAELERISQQFVT